LAQPVSAGVVTITMIENAGSISVSMSGSLDFTSAGSANSAGFSDYIGPANGTIGFGSSATLTQAWFISDSSMAVQSSSPVQSRSGVFFPLRLRRFCTESDQWVLRQRPFPLHSRSPRRSILCLRRHPERFRID
jgi:hypothetical protein